MGFRIKRFAGFSTLTFFFLLLGLSLGIRDCFNNQKALNDFVGLRGSYDVSLVDEYGENLEQEARLSISSSRFQPKTESQPFWSSFALELLVLNVLSLSFVIGVTPFMKKHKLLKQIMLGVVVVLVAFSIGFFAGQIYAQSHWKTIELGSFTEVASYIIYQEDSFVYAKNGKTGQIDFNGTDAATVIQNAITALPADDMGIIQLNLGVFENPVFISKAIILRGKLTLMGRGPYSTYLKLANGVNDSMFKFNVSGGSYYYFTMMNLGLDGNSENNAAGSLLDVNTNLYDGLIFNCHFQNAKEYCIKLFQPWNWRISHSTIELAKIAGLYVTGGDDFKAIETKFLFNAIGADIRCHRARFIGCFFFRNRQNGLYVQDSDSLTLIGTQFRKNSYRNVNTYDEILLYDAVDHFKAIGVSIDGMNTSRYGINLCTLYIKSSRIIGCSIVNMVTAPVWNSGIDTQIDGTVIPSGTLSSLVVRNSGTATGASPIVVSHGLAGTPTVVTLGVNAIQPWSTSWTANSTHITIYHSASSDITVTWYAEYRG